MSKGEGYSKEAFDRAAQKALDESPEVQKFLEHAHEEALELNRQLAPLLQEAKEAGAAVAACWEKYGNNIDTPEKNAELRKHSERSLKAWDALIAFAGIKLGYRSFADDYQHLFPSKKK